MKYIFPRDVKNEIIALRKEKKAIKSGISWNPKDEP